MASSTRLVHRRAPVPPSKSSIKTENLSNQSPPELREDAASQDLSSVTNPCTRLREDARPLSTCDSCIGYLAGQGTDRYMVYKRHQAPPSHGTAVSLSKLILRHRRQQFLPKPDKWRLAGALSSAVMLYHSTPWLQSELKSDDILFFVPNNIDNRRNFKSLKHPHLPSSKQQRPKKSQSLEMNALARDGYIKNEMLYCLGIILLELEFEDTLDSLIVESKNDGFAHVNDVPLTQHCLLLKRRAGTQLGTMYGRIVRMCLGCDFGLGLDEYSLDDPNVQRVFLFTGGKAVSGAYAGVFENLGGGLEWTCRNESKLGLVNSSFGRKLSPTMSFFFGKCTDRILTKFTTRFSPTSEGRLYFTASRAEILDRAR